MIELSAGFLQSDCENYYKLEFLYDWLGYIVIQAAELSKKMLENPVLERV